MEMEKEEIDLRAERPINTPPSHLEEEKKRTTILMMNKRASASEVHDGEFHTVEEEVRIERMRSLDNDDDDDDDGRHRVSRLEKMVRVLKRTHSSLRREYWTSPPTSDELRLHHLILIHVTSYISLFDIELSSSLAPAFSSCSQQQGDDDDPEELNDALDIEALPAAFSSFLQESRKAACPRPEDDPLLKDTWALKSMMEDNTRNGEKKEELLRVLSDLEVIGRSRGYAPHLRGGREIQCYREIRNLTIFSILFVNSCAVLQSDALTPGLDHFSCIPEANDHFITHTPLRHYLSAAFEMIPFRRSFLEQCRHHISRILETKEEEEDDEDLVMEGGEAVGISNNTSAAAEAHLQDIRGGGRRTPPLMMSRVECLQTIVSKFLRIGSLPCCPNPPTKEEARLYAQIAEHVYSSLWLFRCAKETQRTSTGTGSLKTIDATDAWDYSNPDSDPSAARGIYMLLYLLLLFFFIFFNVMQDYLPFCDSCCRPQLFANP